MKATAAFKTTSNEDSREWIDVKLYKEDGEYVWRIGGEFGDECEILPKPKNVKQAKKDALSIFRNDIKANWN